MKLPPRVALLACLALASCGAPAPDSGSTDLAKNARLRAFETWGDEWFEVNPGGEVPAYDRFRSKRADDGGGQGWIVACERFMAARHGILVERTETRIDDTSSLAVRESAYELKDGPWHRKAIVTFRGSSAASVVDFDSTADKAVRQQFHDKHTWSRELPAGTCPYVLVPKRVELMALEGIDRLDLPILIAGDVSTATIQFAGIEGVEFEGHKVDARRFEISETGEGVTRIFWVNLEHGLVQIGNGKTSISRRVTGDVMERAFQAEFARQAREDEAELKWRENHPEGKANPAYEVRVKMKFQKDGEKVTYEVNDSAAADWDEFKAAFKKETATGRKRTGEVLIIIDARPDVPWKHVIEIMDHCKTNGLDRVELAAPMPGDWK